MGTYVVSNLINDEVIKYEGKKSFVSILPAIIIGIILLPFYGIGLFFLIPALISYYTTELAITDKRVIAKFGLIRRSTVELNINKVESLQIEQSFLGRIFNFGSIIVSGGGNPQAPIPGIIDPLRFKRRFFEVQESL